jgi:hypothetical protein
MRLSRSSAAAERVKGPHMFSPQSEETAMSEATRTGASFGDGPITPSDTVDLRKVDGRFPRALRVNGAGDVAIMAPDGSTAIWTTDRPETIPMQTKRVLASGTTITASIAPLY